MISLFCLENYAYSAKSNTKSHNISEVRDQTHNDEKMLLLTPYQQLGNDPKKRDNESSNDPYSSQEYQNISSGI